MVGLSATVLAACTSGVSSDGTGDAGGPVLVFAASSLTDVVADLEAAFEAVDDVDIDVSAAGSSALGVQIEEGAPADVAAFADTGVMARLVDAALVDDPSVFATNDLTIAVPRGNTAGVASIDDFARDELLLGGCARQVPCGGYATQIFDMVGIEPSLDTEEPDVRSLTSKVAIGELDAAIVYATDVLASDGDLVGIDLPSGVSVAAEYPIAVIADSDRPAAAQRFVDFVLGPEGRSILDEAGFGAP